MDKDAVFNDVCSLLKGIYDDTYGSQRCVDDFDGHRCDHVRVFKFCDEIECVVADEFRCPVVREAAEHICDQLTFMLQDKG